MINELLGNKITEPTKIYCDNSAAVLISNNDCSPGKSRTINTKVAKIRRYILDKTIEVVWIPGDSNIADIFTKPLGPQLHTKFANKLVKKIQ